MTGRRGDLAAEIQRKSAEIESWPDWAQPFQPPSAAAPPAPPPGASERPESDAEVHGAHG
jgi:hypothetical protein